MPLLPKGLLASGAKTAALELLAPGGLFLLALLVPLVVLYILKIKRSRRRVASTWLWAAAQRDLMAKAPFKRLVAQVPLLVQAAALVALALALARPATRGREMTGDHVAIVVDTSASMSALAGGAEDPATTRLDLAKRAARDMVASLAPGSDALVLEAGREARLLSPLDRDRVRVRAAIDRIGPARRGGRSRRSGRARGRPPAPARRGAAHRGDHGRRTSRARGPSRAPRSPSRSSPSARRSTTPPSSASTCDPGSTPRSARSRCRGSSSSPTSARGRGTYTSPCARRTPPTSSRRAASRWSPGERVPVELSFYPSPGDYRKGLIFELSPRDAMPVDDVAYARVPAGDKLPVYLAGASPWVERALASDPMVDLHAVTVAELAADSIRTPSSSSTAPAPTSPPGGDLLVVHPPPGRCLGAVVGAAIEHPEITSWDARGPAPALPHARRRARRAGQPARCPKARRSAS